MCVPGKSVSAWAQAVREKQGDHAGIFDRRALIQGDPVPLAANGPAVCAQTELVLTTTPSFCGDQAPCHARCSPRAQADSGNCRGTVKHIERPFKPYCEPPQCPNKRKQKSERARIGSSAHSLKLIDPDIRKTWYVVLLPVFLTIPDSVPHLGPQDYRTQKGAFHRAPIIPLSRTYNYATDRQDSLGPSRRRYPRVHHPSPQAGTRSFVQEACPPCRQVCRRFRSEGNGHLRCQA